MRAQLEHIAEMAGLAHVTVQVLPFRVGAHPAMDGFIVMGFPEPSDPDGVYLQSQAGSLHLEKPAEAERYAAIFKPPDRQSARPGRVPDPDHSSSSRDDLTRRPKERGDGQSRLRSFPCGVAHQQLQEQRRRLRQVADNPARSSRRPRLRERSGAILIAAAFQWRQFTAAIHAGEFTLNTGSYNRLSLGSSVGRLGNQRGRTRTGSSHRRSLAGCACCRIRWLRIRA
jgi:Domain of unknown function (DUF5753)